METPEQIFASEATKFQRWIIEENDQGADAIRSGLLRLLHLYTAGLMLPSWLSISTREMVERISQEERHLVHEKCHRLPLQFYGEIFDPLLFPHQEPVTGSLSDDLCDIYGDVIPALRAYEAGQKENALWAWSFNLHSHWGEHATGAIRAMHCWLTKNTMDLQSTLP